MTKNFAIATAMAAIAASGVLGAGCAGNNNPSKAAQLAILSDRGCIPPPYASPSQHSFAKRAPEAAQPPATIKDEQTFVPAPANEGSFTPATTEQAGDAPVFTPVPATQDNAPAAKSAQAKPAEAPKQAAEKPVRTYKVKRGDYLSVIAYMYKVSTQDLAAENDMQLNTTLHEGRILKLPEYAAETPRPRPTAKKKPAQTKASAKGDKQAGKNEAKAAESGDKDVYIVQANDNFWTIVRNNKVKAEDVRALNPQIKDFAKLQIGDKIRLRPSNASATSPAAGGAEAAPKADAKNEVPVAPIQFDAQPVQEQAPAPANNGTEADAQVPAIKPVALSPSVDFTPLPMNTAPATQGNATAE